MMSPPSERAAPPTGVEGGADRRRARRLWNGTVLALCHLAAAALLMPLGLIVWHLFARGLSRLSPGFFLHLPSPVGEPGGGMANAIAGTLILVGWGTLIAVPIGVGAGFFLAEYGHRRVAGPIRYTADGLSGV